MAMPLTDDNKRLVSALEEALNILGAECVLLIKVSTTDCLTQSTVFVLLVRQCAA